MPQSLVCNYMHIVFATKSRQPFLKDEAIRLEMHAYLGGISRNHNSPALLVGGTEDHVHALVRVSQSSNLDALIREMKRDSSKWIKTKGNNYLDFHWQRGYGGFSVSPSHIDALKKYIETQMEHHRKETCQDEFRRLLARYGITCDESHVWD